MRSLKLLPFLIFLGAGCTLAQSPTFGLGKTPKDEEKRAWAISISPTGEELLQDHGTAAGGGGHCPRHRCATTHGVCGPGGRSAGGLAAVSADGPGASV